MKISLADVDAQSSLIHLAASRNCGRFDHPDHAGCCRRHALDSVRSSTTAKKARALIYPTSSLTQGAKRVSPSQVQSLRIARRITGNRNISGVKQSKTRQPRPPSSKQSKPQRVKRRDLRYEDCEHAARRRVYAARLQCARDRRRAAQLRGLAKRLARCGLEGRGRRARWRVARAIELPASHR
jgi:hypothetical protein